MGWPFTSVCNWHLCWRVLQQLCLMECYNVPLKKGLPGLFSLRLASNRPLLFNTTTQISVTCAKIEHIECKMGSEMLSPQTVCHNHIGTLPLGSNSRGGCKSATSRSNEIQHLWDEKWRPNLFSMKTVSKLLVLSYNHTQILLHTLKTRWQMKHKTTEN